MWMLIQKVATEGQLQICMKMLCVHIYATSGFGLVSRINYLLVLVFSWNLLTMYRIYH